MLLFLFVEQLTCRIDGVGNAAWEAGKNDDLGNFVASTGLQCTEISCAGSVDIEPAASDPNVTQTMCPTVFLHNYHVDVYNKRPSRSESYAVIP